MQTRVLNEEGQKKRVRVRKEAQSEAITTAVKQSGRPAQKFLLPNLKR